jgi:hypothetical protein
MQSEATMPDNAERFEFIGEEAIRQNAQPSDGAFAR